MTGVDSLGFEMMVTCPDQPQDKVRLNYPQPAPGSGAVRRALVAMVKQARAAQQEA
jgi:putative heme iron utilization protein